jgi:hypothetical protein
MSSKIFVFRRRLHEPCVMSTLAPSSYGYAYYQYNPAMDAASLAGSSIQLSHSAATARSSGKASAHRVAALPRLRAADGGELALPRWLREGGDGLGRGKAPSCSSAWSARTPTL